MPTSEEHQAKIAELQLHEYYRISKELTVYKSITGLVYVTYKEELLDLGTTTEIRRVPTSSTFVPYK